MTANGLPQLEPGIYFDNEVPDEQYFKLPYASKSGMWKAHLMPETVRTIEQAQAWISPSDIKMTEALKMGRAFDDAMQQGKEWRDNWEVGPVNPKTNKGYGDGTIKFKEGVNNPDQALTPESLDRVDELHNACLAHPQIVQMLMHEKARQQVVVIWDDGRTGQRCKGKIDLWTVHNGVSTHVDWKTWTKRRQNVPTEIAFSWEVEDRGYNVQAAHYLDGCESLAKLAGQPPHIRTFSIVAINKTPNIIPATGEELYDVDILDFRSTQIEQALRVRDAMLDKWISIKNGTWKPSNRTSKTLRLSNYQEDKYGNEPESN